MSTIQHVDLGCGQREMRIVTGCSITQSWLMKWPARIFGLLLLSAKSML